MQIGDKQLPTGPVPLEVLPPQSLIDLSTAAKR